MGTTESRLASEEDVRKESGVGVGGGDFSVRLTPELINRIQGRAAAEVDESSQAPVAQVEIVDQQAIYDKGAEDMRRALEKKYEQEMISAQEKRNEEYNATELGNQSALESKLAS